MTCLHYARISESSNDMPKSCLVLSTTVCSALPKICFVLPEPYSANSQMGHAPAQLSPAVFWRWGGSAVKGVVATTWLLRSEITCSPKPKNNEFLLWPTAFAKLHLWPSTCTKLSLSAQASPSKKLTNLTTCKFNHKGGCAMGFSLFVPVVGGIFGSIASNNQMMLIVFTHSLSCLISESIYSLYFSYEQSGVVRISAPHSRSCSPILLPPSKPHQPTPFIIA